MKIINLPFNRLIDQGISLYESGCYRKAIALFDKVIRQDNEAVVAYYYRGLSKYSLDQYKEAIADYDRIIVLTTDYDEVYEKRGRARLVCNQGNLAIYDCNEAMRINPYNADAFEVSGTAKIKLGDTISGNEDLDKARQLRAHWGVRVPNSSYKNVRLRSLVNGAITNGSE